MLKQTLHERDAPCIRFTNRCGNVSVNVVIGRWWEMEAITKVCKPDTETSELQLSTAGRGIATRLLCCHIQLCSRPVLAAVWVSSVSTRWPISRSHEHPQTSINFVTVSSTAMDQYLKIRFVWEMNIRLTFILMITGGSVVLAPSLHGTAGKLPSVGSEVALPLLTAGFTFGRWEFELE